MRTLLPKPFRLKFESCFIFNLNYYSISKKRSSHQSGRMFTSRVTSSTTILQYSSSFELTQGTKSVERKSKKILSSGKQMNRLFTKVMLVNKTVIALSMLLALTTNNRPALLHSFPTEILCSAFSNNNIITQ